MKHIVLSVIALMCCLAVAAQTKTYRQHIAQSVGIDCATFPSDCDTVVISGGNRIRLKMIGGQISHIGFDLFPPEIKKSSDREMLDYIETALLVQSRGIRIDGFDHLSILSGKISDVSQITPSTDVTVSKTNDKTMTVKWPIANGLSLVVEASIGYQNAKGGTRSEIEDAFITALKRDSISRPRTIAIQLQELEPYRDSLLILRGESYQNNDINRNIYLKKLPDSAVMVWDKLYPLESIANLIISPDSAMMDVITDITVLRHEYGEKTSLSVPFSRLLAVSGREGCLSFWGVERFQDGVLDGALFLCNKSQGYNHVLKISCKPADIIRGGGRITARASLFIPVNNVHNLFQPYQPKTDE